MYRKFGIPKIKCGLIFNYTKSGWAGVYCAGIRLNKYEVSFFIRLSELVINVGYMKNVKWK